MQNKIISQRDADKVELIDKNARKNLLWKKLFRILLADLVVLSIIIVLKYILTKIKIYLTKIHIN